MKLVRGEALNWGAVKRLLGDDAEAIESSSEMAQLEAMTYEADHRAVDGDWPMVDIERSASEGEMEAAACISSLIVKHHEVLHIPVGLWNHPLNLGDLAIEQILKSLGYPRNDAGQSNPMGRIFGWPA